MRERGRSAVLQRGPARRLVGLAGFSALGLGLSALSATTGVGVPCPLRVLTGWQCPFCGGTRLGVHLLQGDLAAAFAANPVVLVALVVLALLAASWTVQLLGGPVLRVPRPLAARLTAVGPTVWLAAGVLAATVLVVLRHLL